MAYLSMSSPDVYRKAVRDGVALTYSADASLAGVSTATDLRPTGGSITDTTKPGVRRTLSLDLPGTRQLFDALAPVGTQLKVWAHVRYTDRTSVDIPMGVFDVDSEKISEGGGSLSITAPDKWARVQRAQFIRPQASQAGQYVTLQITDLIRGALGAGETVLVKTGNTAIVGAMVWEKDRAQAIIDLAAGIGCWVYFDRDGVATIADIPTAGTADWLVDASATGVMTELDRERSRTGTSNVVVVSSSSTDPATAFTTQIVWDADPNSPTYAGDDPVRFPQNAGPFGIVPFYYDTPLPLGNNGAYQAGWTILARESGLASQVSLGQVPNPALDAFDVLDVMPPAPTVTTMTTVNGSPVISRSTRGAVLERHIADTVTHGLTVGTAQHIDGRSTRAS